MGEALVAVMGSKSGWEECGMGLLCFATVTAVWRE